MIYKIRPGFPYPQQKAQEIGEELDRLASEAGSLSAADVVQAASDGGSVLHEYFEWDDVRAAQLYRETQGRQLMRSVTVIVQTPDTRAEVRAFYSVRGSAPTPDDDQDQPERRYVPVTTISRSPVLAEQVIQSAYDELEGWRDRYEHYRRVFPPFETRFRPVLEFIDMHRTAKDEQFSGCGRAADQQK